MARFVMVAYLFIYLHLLYQQQNATLGEVLTVHRARAAEEGGHVDGCV